VFYRESPVPPPGAPVDDARARVRAVGSLPASHRRAARRRLPHPRARPSRVRSQRQGGRRAGRARPRARGGAVPRRPRASNA
jgi:hypothetical protein